MILMFHATAQRRNFFLPQRCRDAELIVNFELSNPIVYLNHCIIEFSLKRAIFVKIKAERIFEPELTHC